MKFPSRNLYVHSALTVLLAFAVLAAGAIAYGELQQFKGVEGRDYHAKMYRTGRCTKCHESNDPSGYPLDGACLECHEQAELAMATLPEAEEDRWQNPHDSLHYGADVPCVECHGEHSSKEPLCADCHNFDYAYHQL